MANRKDFFFKQLVTEAELDAAFDGLENADRNLAIDLNLVGIAYGLEVTQQAVPNLTVQVAGPGAAYDQLGERMVITATQNVDLSVDENSVSTTVSTPGNSRILSVFLKFRRLLTDLRTDGNSLPVYFDRAESFEFKVAMGAEAASPVAPALRSDQILLADVTRAFGQTTFVNANISTTRRQHMFKTTASTSGLTVNQGRLIQAFQSLVDQIGGQSGSGGAGVMGIGARTTWLGGRTNPAATLFAAIDKIITDLAATTASDDGAERIGAQVSGNLTAGSVRSQLDELDTEKAKLAGGNSFSGTQSIAGQVTITGAGNGINATGQGSDVNVQGTMFAGAGNDDDVASFADNRTGPAGFRSMIMAAPMAGGGTQKYWRLYASESPGIWGAHSFQLTTNAFWDEGASAWNKDDTGVASQILELSVDAGMAIGFRASGAGTWASSGWTLFVVNARNLPAGLSANVLYKNGMVRGWGKFFSGASITTDEEYGVASTAAAGGGGVTITWDVAASGTFDQVLIGTVNSTGAAFLTVEPISATTARVRAWDDTGAQIDLSTNVGIDWSVLRFCTTT